MQLIGQAMRAVVVEMLGVLVVLWLLFGTAAWTLDSYTGRTESQPSSSNANPVQQVVRAIHPAASAWFEPQEPRRLESDEVARLLDHYSSVYRDAAAEHLREVVRH